MDIGYWILDPHVRVYISTGKVKRVYLGYGYHVRHGLLQCYSMEHLQSVYSLKLTVITSWTGSYIQLFPLLSRLLEITTR